MRRRKLLVTSPSRRITPEDLGVPSRPPAPVGSMPDRPDPAALLSSVAAALTACEQAGIKVRLRHGAVMTREGYVLPLGDGRWRARTLAWTEFSPEDGDGDDG